MPYVNIKITREGATKEKHGVFQTDERKQAHL